MQEKFQINKSYIFVDCEYIYTCAVHEGKIPNYKFILDILNKDHPASTKIAYFVGAMSHKKGIADYLIKIGFEYVNVLNFINASKTQIISSAMSVDVAKLLFAITCEKFIFISGDDYMLNIIDFLNEKTDKICVYYFPLIFNNGLINKCLLTRLPDSCFMYSK